MDIEKVSNTVIYTEINGILELKVNGKDVSVSYYKKQDNDFAIYDNERTIQGNNLTIEEYNYIEEVWEDYI